MFLEFNFIMIIFVTKLFDYQVFLLDPTNEDVVPVVRELQRRLFIIDTNQKDDQISGSPEVEVDEDDGMFDPNYTSFLKKVL